MWPIQGEDYIVQWMEERVSSFEMPDRTHPSEEEYFVARGRDLGWQDTTEDGKACGQIPRYLFHLEKDLPKMQPGMGNLTDRHLDSGEEVWPALGTGVPMNW